MKIPLATNLKTRVGDTTKDARLKNAYVEVRGEQSVVRHRPSARGGVAVGSGVAQGGYGTVLFWGDTAYTISDSTGTTWDSGANYSIGDHVSVGFVDYWALTNNTNQNPTTNSDDWSESYVPSIGIAPYMAGFALISGVSRAIFIGEDGEGLSYTGLGGSTKNAYARDITSDGLKFVGESVNSSGVTKATLWDYVGTTTDLGHLGGQSSSAYAIALDGSFVVGNSLNASSKQRAFKWTSSGGMVELSTLGGGVDDVASAYAISNITGNIYGYSSTTSGADIRACVWDSSLNISSIGDSGTIIYATNRSGNTQVGSMTVDSNTLAARRKNAVWESLGHLGYPNSTATGVSENGDVVVGWSKIDATTYRAFKWTEADGMVNIGTLGGNASLAYGVSRDGNTIVGQAALASGVSRGFVYTESGGMVEANIFTSLILSGIYGIVK